MTGQELFRRAHRRLSDAGLDGREAELILRSATGITREALYRENPEAGLEHCRIFEAMLERRLSGEPLVYVTGTTRFLELDLHITPDVLIPRPETEWMVAAIIDHLRGSHELPRRILDIGTGSGCIALSLARVFPDALVVASDASLPALKLAALNAVRNGLGSRTHFFADLFPGALSASSRFDLIVSNPPYVAERDRDSLDSGVKDFEPPGALFAGSDGLDFFRRSIPSLVDCTGPGAHVFLEIGHGQGLAVSSLFGEEFREVAVWNDLAGKERVVTARRDTLNR